MAVLLCNGDSARAVQITAKEEFRGLPLRALWKVPRGRIPFAIGILASSPVNEVNEGAAGRSKLTHFVKLAATAPVDIDGTSPPLASRIKDSESANSRGPTATPGLHGICLAFWTIVDPASDYAGMTGWVFFGEPEGLPTRGGRACGWLTQKINSGIETKAPAFRSDHNVQSSTPPARVIRLHNRSPT